MKLVAGYKSATDVKLALERGEVQGTFANGWSDVKTQSMTWLKEGKIRVVAQHGFKPHPELKDVPLFMDEAKTDADRQALVFMLARQEAAKPYFAPPGVPEARMAILRAAFDATMKDPEFLKDAATQNLAVEEPLTGAEVAALVKSASSTPAEVVNRVQAILAQGISGR
jgi:tripartite-type tricarboxylate transporter receptor subunit TctC